MAWWSKSKPKANADVAVEKYLEHCAAQGQRLEMLFKSKLAHYCDGHSGRPSLSAILHRPFVTFQNVRFQEGSRSLFAAHCYALALNKCAEETAELPWYAHAVEHLLANLITAEEVGPENVGHAPDPYPEPGVHLHYLPGTLVGGVASQQLALYRRYRTVRFDAVGNPIKGQREIDLAEADIVVRIFREYAEGKSAKAIAAGLNTDGIVGPRGGIWRQNTINGNRARGTGILNNELYVGWLVWNRLEYKTKSVNLGGRQAAPRKSTAKPRVSRLRAADQIVRVPLPDLRIVPQDLWDAVKARQKALDAKLLAQQAASGGRDRRAGIGATRRSLTVLAGVLSCGTCGGRMTPSGGRYLRCSTAAETGGSICDHTRNHRRDHIETEVLAALSDELMRPDALEYFIDVYNREVAGATARHAVERQALEAEMGRVDREIANLVTAIAGGLNNPSVKARLDALEAERAVLLAESAKPAPAAISLHPGAASLWRAKIRALWAALGEGDGAAMTRETLRGLIERVTLVPDRTAEAGFVVELEGRLAEMLQVVGIKTADAELVDSASAVSGQLVAGARNHRNRHSIKALI